MPNEEPRAYPHPPVREDWLSQLREDIIEPALPIVDPHHHLWARAGDRYVLDELLADADAGHNVEATVFIECGSAYRTAGPEELRPVGETEFVARVVAESERRGGPTRVCAGIVGRVDFRLADRVAAALEAHVAAGAGRFRGIRHSGAWDATIVSRVPGPRPPPPAHMFADPDFRRGFAYLARFGMSFEAWVYHPQIPEATDLARAHPDIPIVLDHVGGPLRVGPYRGRGDEVFREWRAAIGELARCPNTHVKLGGLAMAINGFDFHERPLPPSSEELADAWRPWIETCIETFGPGRCMFESNFPVDKGMCSYPVLWNAFKRLATGASATEKAALFHDTAARFYRIGDPRRRT
jgi:L-fuconolactonase